MVKSDKVKEFTKKIKDIEISPPKSFDYWSLLEWAKGQKKSLIAVVMALLGLWVLDDVLLGLLAALVVNGVLAVYEYWLKKKEVIISEE